MATRRQRKLAEEREGDQEESSSSEAETEPVPMTEMAFKYKLEMKRLEMEAKERQRERELEMEKEAKQREFEERQRVREFERELELKRMEFELEKQRLALSQTSNDVQEGRSGGDTPDLMKKFPKYTKDDCPEKFLISFERCCRDFGVAKEKWMTYLRPQISGKLLQIYGQLPEESYRDYDLFKKQVQQEFRLTPEYYRFKFRSLKKDKTQSFAQVASRLSQLFDSWIKTSEVEDYQQLRELLKLEQFFQLVPYEIRWVIQDRKPSTIVEAAGMADQITTLKEGFKREDLPGDKRTNRQPFYSQQKRPQQEKGADIEDTPYRRQSVIRPTAPEVKRRCFQCGEWNHLKYQCPLLKKEKTTLFVNKMKETPRAEADTVSKESSSSEPQEKQCLFILSGSPSKDYLETISIDHKDRKGFRDTGSEICIAHPEIIPQKFQQPTSEIKLKGLGPAIPTPVVTLPIEYKGWKGVWDFAVSPDIPYQCLIGNDLAEEIKFCKMACGEKECNNESPEQKALCFAIQQDGDESPESSATVTELIKETGGVREIQQEQRAEEQPYRFIAEDGVPNIKSEVYSQKRPCKRGTSPAAEPIPVAVYLRTCEESIETIGLERQVINSEEKEESLTLKYVFPSAPHKEITSAELFDKDNKIKVKEKAKGKQTLDVTVEADASSEYPGIFCETKIHTSEEKVNRKRRFGHVSEERSPLSLNGEERENKSQADRLTRKLIYTDYIGDDKKKKLQFLALEVCPDSSDELAMKKDNIRVRSSKDSEFSSVPRKDARGIPDYSLQPDASWKQAIVQALKIDGNKTVPDNWKVRQKKKPKKKKRRSGKKEAKRSS